MASVFGPVVQQVAALAPRREVLEAAVRWVVVEVTGGKPDDGPAEPIGFVGADCATTALIPPGAILAIKPTPISHAKDGFCHAAGYSLRSVGSAERMEADSCGQSGHVEAQR